MPSTRPGIKSFALCCYHQHPLEKLSRELFIQFHSKIQQLTEVVCVLAMGVSLCLIQVGVKKKQTMEMYLSKKADLFRAA